MRTNFRKTLGYALMAGLTFCMSAPVFAQAPNAAIPMYNNAKKKLMEGKVPTSFTISTPDPAFYCEVAKHHDFVWFEMQHSTMTWADIEKMVAACPRQMATPMVRIMDDLEASIQHAMDIGLLGIIMPTVDTVEKAENTVKYAKFPPEGRRSMGGGQYARIWFPNDPDAQMKYRMSVNDNILIITMIESPEGVNNSLKIANVQGVDGLLIANTDLANFSGYFDRNLAPYQAMMRTVHDNARRAGKWFGATGPVPTVLPFPRSEFNFYQNNAATDGWKRPDR